MARSIALGRVALGAVALLAPGFTGRMLLGTSAPPALVAMLARLIGIRDLVIGLATLRALDGSDDRSGRRMVLLGAACDASDAMATSLALRQVPYLPKLPSVAMLAGATGATAVAIKAASDLS